MLKGRVGEAVKQAVSIGCQINVGDAQRRGLLIQHQPAGSLAETVVLHTFIYVRVASKVAQIREEGVAAVQHPKLHLLPGQDILNHLYACNLPLRTSGDKVIFHYPLNERFTADGAGIFNAKFPGDFRE